MGKPKDKQKSETIVSRLTAEVIDSTEVAISAIADIDNEINNLKAQKKAIKKEYQLDTKEMRTQKRFFYKLYKNDYEKIFKDMSPQTMKVLMFFVYNMSHKDNSVVINGVYPSQAVLVDKSGVGDTMYRKAVKKLIEMNIIRSERKGKFNKIYINPLLCEDSMTEKEIWYKFELE